MRNITAIIGKELKSYFVSPVAYVVMAGFIVPAGWFFFNLLAQFNRMLTMYQAFRRPDILQQFNLNDMVMTPFLYNLTIVLMFIIPLITMRLFAEERKLGTEELLLTLPLRTSEVVIGKFAASFIFYLIILALTAIYPILLFAFGNPEAGPILVGYLGLFLLGTSFIAVGIFASSLTENQIVAYVVSFVAILMFFIIGWPAQTVGASTLGEVLSYLSLVEHFTDFSKGLIDTKHIAYYITFILFCLFLTKRSFESLKWR